MVPSWRSVVRKAYFHTPLYERTIEAFYLCYNIRKLYHTVGDNIASDCRYTVCNAARAHFKFIYFTTSRNNCRNELSLCPLLTDEGTLGQGGAGGMSVCGGT
ncbi:hypothetical protein ZHAS_00004079 [Anopheles sinensis]|uniref:Uncharacterized protein n=1 Tax=Anopheles sinensis TaxID=74873 RepID=A0A084VG15_ANOSI|nr:hypothetical protein ZHAS_00004079 [Anopheles sinensis]